MFQQTTSVSPNDFSFHTDPAPKSCAHSLETGAGMRFLRVSCIEQVMSTHILNE